MFSDAIRERIERLRQVHKEHDMIWRDLYLLPYPRGLDEWGDLALCAGIDAEFVEEGKWTPRELAPKVEEYVHQVRDEDIERGRQSRDRLEAMRAVRSITVDVSKVELQIDDMLADGDARSRTKLRKVLAPEHGISYDGYMKKFGRLRKSSK